MKQLTLEEWIIFISFTVVINIVFQVTAWRIGYWIGTKQRKEKR